MNRKTIKRVLSRKFNEWVASIEDEKVRALAQKNTIISGGAFTSMLLNEKINDFDLYFRNYETASSIAKYYINKFNNQPVTSAKVQYKEKELEDNFKRIIIYIASAGVASTGETENYQYFETLPQSEQQGAVDDYLGGVFTSKAEKKDDLPNYAPIFCSYNAITLKNKIQLVFRFYGEPEELHKNFDFVHTTNYWESTPNKVTLQPRALEATLAKELHFVNSLYPLTAMIRLRKFIRRGWHINAGQMLKIAHAINQIDFNNIDQLKDQLTGVDSAYFAQVIGALERKKESDPDFELNHGYLTTLIDKIFG